ncbi:heme A synthase [Paenibacillaceae bacterium]|nr:heme A synthase [Paenibacillaceae bacterium]
MLLVLLAGALVTNTGSGRGCGDDWPLCHGKFIPAYTLESLIEYTHRAVSGIVGLLVLALFIVVIRHYRQHREALFYSGTALFFTIVQALLGAAAVMWPQSPPVMALHFGFSVLAFASTMLMVLWAYRMRRPTDEQTSKPVVPRTLFKLSLLAFVYIYIIIYIGAFIRHTKSSGGCLGWPLCNGELIPEISGAAGIVFIHRIAALLFLIGVTALAVYINKQTEHKGLRKSGAWIVGLVVAQVFSGALVTWTIGDDKSFIFTSLLHNLIISVLFGLLADLCIRSWKLSKGGS